MCVAVVGTPCVPGMQAEAGKAEGVMAELAAATANHASALEAVQAQLKVTLREIWGPMLEGVAKPHTV